MAKRAKSEQAEPATPAAAGMTVEYWLVSRLIPYDKNPRINAGAVDAVAASIQEFGFRQPIVVDPAGVIIIGHTRRLAAMKLGLATVPVHVAADMSAAQVRALRIADNKTSEIAEWDFDCLASELATLKSEDCIDAIGFDSGEIDRLIGSLNSAVPVDDTQSEPLTETLANDVKMICCPHCGSRFAAAK
jgi:ParB-like chromosome segregation protein Spo0J